MKTLTIRLSEIDATEIEELKEMYQLSTASKVILQCVHSQRSMIKELAALKNEMAFAKAKIDAYKLILSE